MSGHSKFHNIKATKDKADAKRSGIFTKLGREIMVAVRSGGADPATNNKLYDVIAKARRNNMPGDNIQRIIKKASGDVDTVNYEQVTYEGYGAGGVAFIVECLTDNRNRTAGDVRHLFDKAGGSLGTSGSVLFMFSRKGVLVIEKKDNLTEDDVMMVALEADAEDVVTEEDAFIVYTEPGNLNVCEKAFEKAGIEIVSCEVEYISSNYITPEKDQIENINKLIEKLEDLDDVQNVYHNANLDD